MTSSETATVTLRIIRVGECKQCGWCCGFVDGKITEGACSHLTSDGNVAFTIGLRSSVQSMEGHMKTAFAIQSFH
jgi:hypothetical protein